MKVIIAGSRHLTRIADTIDGYNKSMFIASEVVTGCCPTGPDDIGAWMARVMLWVPVKEFKADWKLHGDAAGPIRNRKMAEYADALVLIWDGKSRGSANMLKEAEQRNLKIYQHIIRS